MREIEIDTLAVTNDEWKRLMREKLATATTFEIHCWNEETEEIALALRFGETKDKDWEGGMVITGRVTEEFKRFLLDYPIPCDPELYNKMTPFFSVFLNNGFSSEHYGTELYQI